MDGQAQVLLPDAADAGEPFRVIVHRSDGNAAPGKDDAVNARYARHAVERRFEDRGHAVARGQRGQEVIEDEALVDQAEALVVVG
jgi:hypothetical protein